MPTKMFVGSNCLIKNSGLLRKYGKFCLIVTGAHSSKINGSLEDTITALEKEDIKYRIFDEVEENPSLETVERAFQECAGCTVDFIIAVGGGSAIDAAKALSLLFKNNISAREVLTLKNLKGIPLIAIPTTSGTGSETTPYSVLTDHLEQTKKNIGQVIFPEIAFLDARYTINSPFSITAATAVDAFTHLAEGYLNRNANILSDTLAEKGFTLFGECLKPLKDKCLTLEHREKLLLASTIAGMVISQTGTGLPHGMGYPLTYYKKLPHGTANGILYVGYLNVFRNKEKIMKMLGFIGLESIEDLGRIFKDILDCHLTLTEEEIHTYAEQIIANDQKMKNHPEKVTREDILSIYRSVNLYE